MKSDLRNGPAALKLKGTMTLKWTLLFLNVLLSYTKATDLRHNGWNHTKMVMKPKVLFILSCRII